jgi:multidrug efflux system membrane fusion protein
MRSMTTTAVGLALLIAAGCKKPGPTGEFKPPPAPVSAVAAEAQDVPVYFDEIGRTVARDMVSVQPQISGRITGRHFEDGADVKAGDELFTIDARPFQAQLASAEAALAQSKATLDLARTEFSRSGNLLAQKAISQQDFDTSQGAVAVAEARLKQNEAAVETARLNFEYCSIRSPIDGRAGQRLVDVGNIVEANRTPLLVIQGLDPIYADFTVTERNLAAVQRQMAKGGLKVEIRNAEGTGEALPGDLTFLDNAVQQATGTVKLRATVPNGTRALWPGQFVKVRLILDTLKGAVLVPATAPQLSARGLYVFVVTKASTVEMRPVTLGQRQGDRVVVETGLQAGEQVVTSSSLMVSPGSPVRVVPPAPPQGSKP